ncbi:FAS1-like dehydratase domain-containing protein [Gordonia polyisoprenivorans]|uniref:FAS1-like dehydratase domain-containing protein n=1 Tax=Gordonia polyisoprenivorans TaxID=84595 RepID=UPI001AD67835|nr:MaoC family dehydratase N-terminal domain-containing protein [Gordonia polyisoprenivorans]QTI69943.1 MaoC family dehydratase N-terminal domain-containing protein [Gordonia polyisoprenivorans]
MERGKVSEFRAAVGLPYCSDVQFAPPTFPAAIEVFGPAVASILSDRGIDLGSVLHGTEDITYPGGPLRVGDELTGEVVLTGVEERTGRSGPLRIAMFAIDLARPDGTLAVSVRRSLVIVG